MKYGFLFAAVSLLLIGAAIVNGGWCLLLFWPALSFGIVSAGYFQLGPRVFGKSRDGLLAPINQLLLLPYLLGNWTAWHALRVVKREPPINQLTENIFIGRRLLSHESPDKFDHVIDLTCEFNESSALRSTSYHSFQILDGHVPNLDQLRRWVTRCAELSGDVYIHCAEGHGRTGLFAALLLLHIGHSKTVHEAIQFVKLKRPLVRLGRRQMAVLRAAHDSV